VRKFPVLFPFASPCYRLNFETSDLKAKTVLDSIAMCLNNKTDFTADVVRESLAVLQSDEIPAIPLMRTAILSAQSFPELKKFVLNETIPAMMERRVWDVAPKVWEGVIFGIKNLIPAFSKSVELSLRALLRVPGVQLKAVFKVASGVKTILSQYYRTLSSEEKSELSDFEDKDKQKLLLEISGDS
jgi:hypothetical protein